MKGQKNLTNVIDYYQQGLQAEKSQLSFFMPYESVSKKMISMTLEMANSKPSISSENKSDATVFPDVQQPPKYDLRGTGKVVHQRKKYAEFFEMRQNGHSTPNKVADPPRKSKLQEGVVTYEQVCITDMDPYKNKIYDGKEIEVVIIEPPNILVGIVSTIMDKSGYIERVSFYNFPEMPARAFEKFFVGCRYVSSIYIIIVFRSTAIR
jgi:hypothetical protein